MNTARRRAGFKLLGIALALAAAGSPAFAHDEDHDGPRGGHVFTSSNNTSDNQLLVYTRDASGALTLAAAVSTQGQGTGAGLGSQGAVTRSGDGRYVFVVNAASNTVSTFRIHGDRVSLASVVDSGGLHPISVTESDGMVAVLNAGGAGNVAGFRNLHGTLAPLAGATRGLSAAGGTGPAQVGFGEDGEVLLVTEKATNLLTSYRVGSDGSFGQPI
ncbi:MAG TPA: beta-propeller fold lactonase family protein, partial [Albitalea sp.]|nr:beta-propeller fold lactonase family protein [Albitalea sp.]